MVAVLLTIILLACLARLGLGAEQRGHVVVSKHISAPATSDLIVQGSPFRVTYTAINIGAEPAYAVSVNDVFPPQSCEVRDGTASHKEAELAPGANVTFGVTLVPRVAGVMTVGYADVRYRYRLPPDEDGALGGEGGEEEDLLADARSTSSVPLRKREILSPEVYARVTKQKGPSAVAAALAAAALVLGPYYMFRLVARENDAAPFSAKRSLG